MILGDLEFTIKDALNGAPYNSDDSRLTNHTVFISIADANRLLCERLERMPKLLGNDKMAPWFNQWGLPAFTDRFTHCARLVCIEEIPHSRSKMRRIQVQKGLSMNEET